MNVRKNVRSHTKITHDKFRRNKIQNVQVAAIFNQFFSLSRKSCMVAKTVIVYKIPGVTQKQHNFLQI